MSKDVIIVTDGDRTAQRAVEVAARNVGAACVVASGYGRSRHGDAALQGVERKIKEAECDLALVLVDDQGQRGEGEGEKIVQHLAASQWANILGVIAVASHLRGGRGVRVDASVAADGRVVQRPVDKDGETEEDETMLHGDTVESLYRLGVPLIVGLGDPGKMDFADDAQRGAPITTRAVRLILTHTSHLGTLPY